MVATPRREDSTSVTYTVPNRLLIGIGDLHGHYPALETLLESLQQEYHVFSNPSTLQLEEGVTFVFTGDYIDRGNQALKIIETLQKMAEANPDCVRVIAGNHELMALADYDHAKAILKELESGSPAEHAFTDYISRGHFNGSWHGVNGGIEFLKEFGATPETAFEGYVTRMAKEGDIGSWMRTLEPCFKAKFRGQKILFTHADMPAHIETASGIRQFVQEYAHHLETTTETMGGSGVKYANERLIQGHTLFWERRFPKLTRNEMHKIVEGVDVRFLVVGHTVHPRICNYYNLAFDIDVGMTPKYGENEPAAIVFKNDGVYAHYVRSGEKKLTDY